MSNSFYNFNKCASKIKYGQVLTQQIGKFSSKKYCSKQINCYYAVRGIGAAKMFLTRVGHTGKVEISKLNVT